MEAIIKMDNGEKLIVLKKLVHKGERYVFLSGYDNNDIFFARMVGEDQLDSVEDEELFIELLTHVQEDLQKDPKVRALYEKVLEMQEDEE